MTFIQPNKSRGILNLIFAALAVCLIVVGAAIIILYNRLVNLNHGIDGLRVEFLTLQSQNADIKDKVFESLNAANNPEILAKYGLTQDKNPEYVQINSQWSYASGL
jgi:cell division protein FtsL